MRLDVALTQAGLARSRSHAQSLIRAGRVRVGGTVITKPSTAVASAVQVDVQPDPWVSRAAHKLIGALDSSETAVPDRVLDVGASTGGFTQVLLSRGAERVYAVDVGHGQLAPEVAADPRVVNLEGLHVKDLGLEHLDQRPVELVVADVSFISLRLILAPMLDVLVSSGTALLLVKPQFEVGRARLGHGGVVRSEALRSTAVDGVVAAAAELGWNCDWQGVSELPGQDGNIEFFVRLRHP